MAAAREMATALALAAIMGLELLYLFTGSEWAAAGAHVAMLLLVPLAGRRLGLREAYLLVLCAILTVVLWVRHPRPLDVAQAALDQAAFLMAFILLVSLVQEGARTSRAVIACGTFLARQPGSRRFLALYAGTNLMTVVFNLGSVSLVAPLVRRAAEQAPGDLLTPVRERRQLSAILRGFAWSVVWSPTAVAPLALMELMPGVDRVLWMGLGLLLAAAMMAVGWAEDRWRWRNFTARARGTAPPPTAPLPARAVAGFAVVCAAFAALTGTVIVLSGQGVPASLMAAAPVLLAGWLLVQNREAARPLRGTARQIRGILVQSLPLSAPAAVTLACSGYLGRAGADLVGAAEMVAWLGLRDMPGWLFLTAIPLTVTVLAQLALSPIMMAVFFGTVLGGIPDLPASPTLTALAISAGWALSMTCSPFAAVVILLARISGHSGARLTWRWNLWFSLLAAVTIAGAFWLLTGGR